MRSTLILVAFVAACMPAQEPRQEMLWPDLPTSGVFSGRAATTEDLEAGRAYFKLDSGAVALDIQLPQYATVHAYTGDRVPVIVLQAERLEGKSVAAARSSTSDIVNIITLDRLTLHGQNPPEDEGSHR